MLVKFAMEIEAIDNSTTVAHIKRLLETWERFGILVHPPRGDTSIIDRLKALNPATQKNWVSAWTTVVKNNGNAYRWDPIDGNTHHWEEIDTPDALADCQHKFEVAILEGDSRSCLGNT